MVQRFPCEKSEIQIVASANHPKISKITRKLLNLQWADKSRWKRYKSQTTTSTNATEWKSKIHCRRGDTVMKEGSNCKIGWNNVRERGEEGGEPGAAFCVLSHSDEPPEDRGSAELPHDLPSDFSRYRSLCPRVCFSFIAENTRRDAYHTATVCAPTLFCWWIRLYTLLCGSSVPPLLILHFLTDFFGFHFLFLPSLCLLLISFASLLHCHQLLHAEAHLITSVLHRVGLIKSMPPFPAASTQKEIEGFCYT